MRSSGPPIESPPRPPVPIDPGGGGGDGGGLVRVAVAAHQSEAEFLQQLLAAEGIPSIIRRSRGFDVPDFLASGPRDVLVPRALEMDARDALLQTEPVERRPDNPVEPMRLLIGLLVAVAVVGLIVLVAFG